MRALRIIWKRIRTTGFVFLALLVPSSPCLGVFAPGRKVWQRQVLVRRAAGLPLANQAHEEAGTIFDIRQLKLCKQVSDQVILNHA